MYNIYTYSTLLHRAIKAILQQHKKQLSTINTGTMHNT